MIKMMMIFMMIIIIMLMMLQVKFYGCRHILLEEYDIIRTELSKREYK